MSNKNMSFQIRFLYNIFSFSNDRQYININYMKQVFGYIIKILHFVYTLGIAIAPYITNNIDILLFIIVNNAAILLLWFLLGRCFLTDSENYLFDLKITKKEKMDITNLSFMSKTFIYIFGKKSKNILLALYTIPFINTCLCAYKIYYAKLHYIEDKNPI